ncbi:aminotransferase class IV [Nibribacter koreensis]|uniref:branched-chain-amino-acid transaminase n=1 Tax=Nibribacter koreensis TaxID=1084519 RepID=A0ABP8F9T0_9BACT
MASFNSNYVYITYNGQFLQEAALQLPVTNRAFQYNDGFFETLVVEQGKVRFLAEHWERMQEAASILGLEVPKDLTIDKLEETIQALVLKNECASLARIKLKVWRTGEGLYTPQTDAVDWLLTAHGMESPSLITMAVGICQTVQTLLSRFSTFKGPNSLLYVMASREKKKRQLEDLVLLTASGHVAELTYSNIFWLKDNILYTPSLDTGCLNGVMRRHLLKKAVGKWTVKEGVYAPQALHLADLVFASNVMGLRPIESIEGKPLTLQLPLLEEMRALAFG